MIFMQDYTPSHAARCTTESKAKLGIKNKNMIIRPPSSADLNPIENFWIMQNRKIYADGKQFTSKDELWKVITASTGGEIKNFSSSMDNRILELTSRKGAYINK